MTDPRSMSEDVCTIADLRNPASRFIFQGGSTFANSLADEIETLRQRVKELETYICNDVRDLKIDLAALKAGQGEPFAYSMSAENAAKYPAMLAAPKAPIDLHTQGIYAVLDAEGVPVTGTMAASGYSARAQFVREMSMFWSKAVEQGYRVVALAAIRDTIDT